VDDFAQDFRWGRGVGKFAKAILKNFQADLYYEKGHQKGGERV
jgi:hypothetical protein